MADFHKARIAMVDCQVRPSDVTSYSVIEAMLSVPREEFVPSSFRDVAYSGEHIPVASGRVVLDPRVLAKMLDAAAIRSDDLVLDVGCNLGYAAALMGRMAEAVIAIEESAEMASQAAQALAEFEADNVIVEEQALTGGAPKHGPYDVVFVEGAVEQLPDALASQLKEDGRIVALFANDAAGQCKVGTMSSGRITWRRAFDATAPLLPGFENEKAFEF